MHHYVTVLVYEHLLQVLFISTTENFSSSLFNFKLKVLVWPIETQIWEVIQVRFINIFVYYHTDGQQIVPILSWFKVTLNSDHTLTVAKPYQSWTFPSTYSNHSASETRWLLLWSNHRKHDAFATKVSTDHNSKCTSTQEPGNVRLSYAVTWHKNHICNYIYIILYDIIYNIWNYSWLASNARLFGCSSVVFLMNQCKSVCCTVKSLVLEPQTLPSVS